MIQTGCHFGCHTSFANRCELLSPTSSRVSLPSTQQCDQIGFLIMKLIAPTTLIIVSVLCTHVEAGLFSFCRSSCGGASQRCCEAECQSVKVKKTCWTTECDEVVIPPVCIPSCCDIIKNMCPGKSCCGSGSCGQGDCCEVGCSSQSSPCCLPGKSCGNGLLAKLLSKHTRCRVRCISKLKADSYESEETQVEWKMQQRCGGFGNCGGCTECGTHCTGQ